ncbi:MAG: hypothetical protein ACTJGM_03775 [Fusobacterium sp.]
MKKKILMVTYNFYPDNNPRAFRAFELAKEISKNNKLIIMIPNNNFDYKELEKKNNLKILKIKKGFLFNKFSEGQFLKKQKHQKESFFKRKLKNFFNYFTGNRQMEYAYFVFKKIAFSVEKYDAIISISFPFSCHIGSFFGKKRNKILNNTKLILDCGDPFFYNKTFKKAFYFKWLENYILKNSNFVTIPTLSSKEAYKKYNIDNKIKIIPQGFDFNGIKLNSYFKNKTPSFMYAGFFYKETRNPLKFLMELNRLKLSYNFYIYTFLKKGDFFNQIRKEVEKSKGKIILKDSIPREECIKKMSKMDFLLNLENINKDQSPSKVIDYAISKRPILSFNQENFSISTLKEFLNGNYTKQLKVNLDNYNIKNISDKFNKLIEGE